MAETPASRSAGSARFPKSVRSMPGLPSTRLRSPAGSTFRSGTSAPALPTRAAADQDGGKASTAYASSVKPALFRAPGLVVGASRRARPRIEDGPGRAVGEGAAGQVGLVRFLPLARLVEALRRLIDAVVHPGVPA